MTKGDKMKTFDPTKLEIAIKYVERIADGCNPVNNTPLDKDDVMNNPNIIRCMYFIKDVLKEVQYNGGVIGGRKEKEPWMPFPVEILDEFTYKEDMSITHVLNQIYAPIAEQNIKKISAAKVNTALKEEGYLLEVPNAETGKIKKVPSEKGKELGIYLMDREYNGQMYEAVLYNKSAQEYVVSVVRRMVSE